MIPKKRLPLALWAAFGAERPQGPEPGGWREVGIERGRRTAPGAESLRGWLKPARWAAAGHCRGSRAGASLQTATAQQWLRDPQPARPSSPAGQDQQRPCQYCGRDPNLSRGSFLSPQAVRHGPAGDRCWGSLQSPGLCSRHARYKPRVNDSKYQEVLSPRNSPHQMCGPCLPRGPRHRPAEDTLQSTEREPPRAAPASPYEATVKV
uniref:Uncharacterized protein n=1 Tax=Rangifer tarandus platyrhynchus TaxID=3082113 RepID=A0ACB0E7X1_RANTA|nr:unnamed protein product [Rangifer tarandus platyrhynchus]